jgi:hypothetical protein
MTLPNTLYNIETTFTYEDKTGVTKNTTRHVYNRSESEVSAVLGKFLLRYGDCKVDETSPNETWYWFVKENVDVQVVVTKVPSVSAPAPQPPPTQTAIEETRAVVTALKSNSKMQEFIDKGVI